MNGLERGLNSLLDIMDMMAGNPSPAMKKGLKNAGKPARFFDWDRAAQLIVEKKSDEAFAGLAEDYNFTSGEILVDGKPIKDGGCYLASTWATPTLYLEDESIACHILEAEAKERWGEGWGPSSTWPPSALAVLSQPFLLDELTPLDGNEDN